MYSETQKIPGDHSAKPIPDHLTQGKSVPLLEQFIKLSPGKIFYKFKQCITCFFDEVRKWCINFSLLLIDLR